MDTYPLGPLVVILTLTHLGGGNSGSLWPEEEEKIDVCVCVFMEERCGGNLVLGRCCYCLALPNCCPEGRPEDSGILPGDPWPGHMALRTSLDLKP